MPHDDTPADAPTRRRWHGVDELFAAVDARQEADGVRHPLSDGQLARALATPPPRNPLDDLPRPHAPRRPAVNACMKLPTGARVVCCEGEGDPGCPCACHVMVPPLPKGRS